MLSGGRGRSTGAAPSPERSGCSGRTLNNRGAASPGRGRAGRQQQNPVLSPLRMHFTVRGGGGFRPENLALPPAEIPCPGGTGPRSSRASPPRGPDPGVPLGRGSPEAGPRLPLAIEPPAAGPRRGFFPYHHRRPALPRLRSPRQALGSGLGPGGPRVSRGNVSSPWVFTAGHSGTAAFSPALAVPVKRSVIRSLLFLPE